ncbi:MAG TPA: hypothetical protein VH796_16485 [Nitrososphaeraceae archaeon]
MGTSVVGAYILNYFQVGVCSGVPTIPLKSLKNKGALDMNLRPTITVTKSSILENIKTPSVGARWNTRQI